VEIDRVNHSGIVAGEPILTRSADDEVGYVVTVDVAERERRAEKIAGIGGSFG